MAIFEENEISVKSNGGTEQTKRMVASRLSPDLLAQDNMQVICSRVRGLDESKIRVYWLHDLPLDPETNHLKDQSSRDRFHKLVFCGNWQYNQYVTYLGVPQNDKCVTIETPIEPIKWVEKPKDQVRLIYTSTPQRGLALLIPVFEELAKKHKNIHLDVFSSFSIYGWEESDKPYQELFERCKSHPQITYHGSQPNEVVREYLQKAHIFAYPSIWQECNSRALIEAMSAGCMCIHPNLAGLADTSGGLTTMYQFVDDNNRHANKFYHLLENAIGIANEESVANYLGFVKQYADVRFNISRIANNWEELIRSLRAEYPTVESRAFPTPKFVYKV